MSTAGITQVQQHFGSPAYRQAGNFGNRHLRSEEESTSELMKLLSTAQDEQKTVLLHFWNATSRSSRAVLPHLRRWWELYTDHGLAIVSVHTPEFDFQSHPDYLAQVRHQLDISWPIVSDLAKQIWNDYDNQAWPRTLLIAPTGEVLSDQVGEGNYATTERLVRRSLTHTNRNTLPPSTESGEHTHRLGTLCYPTVPDHYFDVTRKPAPLENSFYLSFGGTEVSAVLASTESSVIEVQLNGKPLLPELRGADVSTRSGTTLVSIQEPRLYELVRSATYIGPAELSLIPRGGTLQSYALRFRGCPES